MTTLSAEATIGHPDNLTIRTVRRRLLRWWSKNRRDFWWRGQNDPYTTALVEILLKQTRADPVADHLRRFVELYPTPQVLAQADEGELEAQLYPFGFQRQRAHHLRALGEALRADPLALTRPTEALQALPGIGPYAAAAISVFAHGRRETVVDVNVVRVFGRLWGLSVERGELRKSKVIHDVGEIYAASTRPRESNWALLDFGALVCTERSPRCSDCPLRDHCASAVAPMDA